MIITWLGHASLFINAAGKTLLLDPWFSEPIFSGTWFRYPPSPYPDASAVPKPDALILTDARADHAGPGTLAQLRPETPTFAPRHAASALPRRLERLRFTRVTWNDPWETVQLEAGLTVTFIPDAQGLPRAGVVIEGDGVRVFASPDLSLSASAADDVVRRLGRIDLAFLPCAPEARTPAMPRTREAGLERFLTAVERLAPAEAVPWASGWAALELDRCEQTFAQRPTPDQALAHAMLRAHALGTHLLRMEPGDEWSPDTGVIEKGLCDGWTPDVEAVREYAEHERDRVAREIAAARHPAAPVEEARLLEVVERWFSELFEHARSALGQLEARLGLTAGACRWSLRFEPGRKPRVERGLRGDEAETLHLSAEELWLICTGPLTWADAWHGERLQVSRAPTAGDLTPFWDVLFAFDGSAIAERLALQYGPPVE